MKNPSYYLHGKVMSIEKADELVEIIKEAQKDAYNQAIRDAAESAKITKALTLARR